jgi:hypothetical protein
VPKCLIKKCDNVVTPPKNPARPKSPVCGPCRATMGRWDKRPVEDILAREGQLEKWQDRMLELKGNHHAKARQVIRRARRK